MYRKVNLLSYLPDFIAQYKEMQLIQNNLTPEVQSIQNETGNLLNNQFILTCDEKGVENFERLLNIRVNKHDDLEVRKRRVLNIWNDNVPYTFEVLLEKLKIICGEDNFVVNPFFNIYEMDITTNISLKGQVAELEKMLHETIPANIKYISENILIQHNEKSTFVATSISTNKVVCLQTHSKKYINIFNKKSLGSTLSKNKEVTLSTSY